MTTVPQNEAIRQQYGICMFIYYAITGASKWSYVRAEPVEFFPLCIKGKGKGKAIPLQTWTGPAGSRRLRLPDFKTIGT